MKSGNLPFKISIATPCPARWTDMNGDDRVRFCTLCQKNVYNLSAMTSQQVTDLVREKEGHLCVRMYKRADDTVITSDCSFGVSLYWRRLKTLVCSGVASILFTMGLCGAIDRDDDGSAGDDLKEGLVYFFNTTYDKILDFLGIEGRAHAKGGIAIIMPPSSPADPDATDKG